MEAGLRDDPKGPLFRTIGRGTGQLTRTPLPQANAYAMIRRRATAAGIPRAFSRMPPFLYAVIPVARKLWLPSLVSMPAAVARRRIIA